MDNSNPKNKPNMPKFNMNWLYIFVIIALGVVFFAGGEWAFSVKCRYRQGLYHVQTIRC